MINYLVLLCCLVVSTSQQEHVITSDFTTNWGTWGSMSRCPAGSYAVSWIQKVEPDKGNNADDTALNAIELNCATPSAPFNTIAKVKSTEGGWGNWGGLFICAPHQIKGFTLRVEEPGGDDTATNNFAAVCTDGKVVVGAGTDWGEWRTGGICNDRTAVCGIQTQVESYQGDGDDTSLNNISLMCCSLPNMAETCIPQENYRTAVVCDNTHSKFESKCKYSFNFGVGYAPGSEDVAKGWEGAGFSLEDAVKDLPKNFQTNLQDEKTKRSFNEEVFTVQSEVSNVVVVPAGVISTISYLTADCAHYSVATRTIRREDASKSGQVVVTYLEI